MANTERCRLCLREETFYLNLFGEVAMAKDICGKIARHLDLNIQQEEEQSKKFICYRCVYKLDHVNRFKSVARFCDKRLANDSETDSSSSYEIVKKPRRLKRQKVPCFRKKLEPKAPNDRAKKEVLRLSQKSSHQLQSHQHQHQQMVQQDESPDMNNFNVCTEDFIPMRSTPSTYSTPKEATRHSQSNSFSNGAVFSQKMQPMEAVNVLREKFENFHK